MCKNGHTVKAYAPKGRATVTVPCPEASCGASVLCKRIPTTVAQPRREPAPKSSPEDEVEEIEADQVVTLQEVDYDIAPPKPRGRKRSEPVPDVPGSGAGADSGPVLSEPAPKPAEPPADAGAGSGTPVVEPQRPAAGPERKRRRYTNPYW